MFQLPCVCFIDGFFVCFVFFQTGRTFLMVASEKGELNIVRELLEAGVDPNAVDNVGTHKHFFGCSCL